jgi:hypothetical protein
MLCARGPAPENASEATSRTVELLTALYQARSNLSGSVGHTIVCGMLAFSG